MATVGQQLLTPESGWQRFDQTNSKIKYTGAWSTASDTGSYGGSRVYTSTEGDTIKFKFNGTKLRLISMIASDLPDALTITIDGVSETFSEYSSTAQQQTLVYEKTGLTTGEHNVEVTATLGGKLVYAQLDAIDIDDTGSLEYLIGSQLTQPETGWKRYDDTMPQFKYEGSWGSGSGAGAWNDATTYTNTTGDTIKFNFEGTQIRIIAQMNSTRSSSIDISIDGVVENFSTVNSTTNVAQALVYEKTLLSTGKHSVIITQKDSNYFNFDAIDIDDTGRLLHPDEVTHPSDLAIGKRIRAHYSAPTSGAVGTFSNLGNETYVDGINDFIPPASSATPDGDFYFIMTSDKHNGDDILVADRNVQHSISWDTLNSAGVSAGSGVPEAGFTVTDYAFTTRLLTGGISSTDTDNEWDKYIVNSTLNNTITAGDDTVWHWKNLNRGWNSTTSTNGSDKRSIKGNEADISAYTALVTSYTTNGSIFASFRPVLEVKYTWTPTYKYLIEEGTDVKTYQDSDWSTVTTTTPTETDFQNHGMNDLSWTRGDQQLKKSMASNGALGGGTEFRVSTSLKGKAVTRISVN